MSSFRRATPAASTRNGVVFAGVNSGEGASPVLVKRPLAGTKPFVNGQTLISTGIAQLDALIGGGWLLGTLVLLDAPRNDAAAASVMLVDDFHRYFLAETVVAGQCAIVVSDDAADFVAHQLPLELSTAQKQLKAQLAAMDVTASDGEQKKQPEQLTIAWQYQKYLASGGDTSGTKQRFCHSYDLSRAIKRELLDANPPVVLDTAQYLEDSSSSLSSSPSFSIRDVYARLFADLQREVEQRAGQQVTRICVRDLGSPLLGAATHEHMDALFHFVKNLRWLCASSRDVVVQLSGDLHVFPVEFVTELRHLCDYMVEIKSFTGEQDLLPAELSEFQGLLEIKKLARIHALACHSMDAVKFGIKRERRKLKIEKFHLPPEGSRSSSDKDNKKKNSSTGGSASAAAAAKSNLVSSSRHQHGAGGCGSGGGGNATGFDPLAF